jgi:hypothetical protein
MVDFQEEIDCYLNSRKVWNTLKAIPDSKLRGGIYSDLLTCYKSLIVQGFVPDAELKILNAWILDHQIAMAIK